MTAPTAALPPDARLLELRPDVLVFETRACLLPGTLVAFSLILEGQGLRLQVPVEALLVVDRDKGGYLFNCRLALGGLGTADQHLIGLFIGKGRGSPGLVPAEPAS